MTFDYARSVATAQRLIANFGQAATLRRKTLTGTAYDPTVATTDYDCTVVVENYRYFEVDGTRILAKDKKVFLSTAGLTITPAVGDQILIESIVHQIINLMPLSPGGTVVMYELQARA